MLNPQRLVARIETLKPYSLWGMTLPLTCGAAAGLSQSFPIFWILSLVSLVPLFIQLRKVRRSINAFFLGWLYGVGLLGVTLYWFFNTFPLDWLGAPPKTLTIVIIACMWLVLIFFISIAVGVWSVVARELLLFGRVWVYLIPIIWVILEYARMWLYTILVWGKGVVFEPHFSFGFLGYALAYTKPMLMFAHLGGIYALSAVVVFINVLLYLLLVGDRADRKYALLGLGVFVVALIAINVHSPEPSSLPTRLAIVPLETNFPSDLTLTTEELLRRRAEITKQLEIVAAEVGPDVVVLPEDSRFIQSLSIDNTDPVDFFKKIFGTREVLIIDSGRVSEDGNTYLRIFYFSTTKGLRASHGKRFLLPFGEHMPYLGELILKSLGQGDAVVPIKHNRSYVASRDGGVFEFKGVRLGVLSCSETVSPWLYNELATSYGADVLINVSSLAWFHHARNPLNQIIAMARVHAVWNGKWFIEATNAGPSFFIDQAGNLYY